MRAAISTSPEGSRAHAAVSYRWVVLSLVWFALLICFVDRLAWGNVALDASRMLGMRVTAVGAFVDAITQFLTGPASGVDYSTAAVEQ